VNRRRLVGAAAGLLTGLLAVGAAIADTPRALGLRAIVGIEPVVGPDGDPRVLIRAVFVDDRRLAVQLSSSDTVQRVVIHGRTADGTPVTGEASVPTLWLVPERDDPQTILGRTSVIVVETPLASADAAAALAREGLDLLVAERVSAETLADGSASLRSGRLVVVQGASGRFDDEVLVSFQHGDLRDPVVVGSLWDSDDRPPPCRDCPPSCDAALHMSSDSTSLPFSFVYRCAANTQRSNTTHQGQATSSR
jgi:hypothetical protein